MKTLINEMKFPYSPTLSLYKNAPSGYSEGFYEHVLITVLIQHWTKHLRKLEDIFKIRYVHWIDWFLCRFSI